MKNAFFLLLLLFSMSIDAKVVPVKKAQEVADMIWSKSQTRSSSNALHYAWDNRSIAGSAQTRTQSDPCFYLFAGENNRGFVIVAAEDQVMPILAYSYEDEAPQSDNLPESLVDWMQTVCSEIEFVRTHHLENEKASRTWASTRAGQAVVELHTAQWDQGSPYNDQCPTDGSQRCLAGCVPVATAIVMKYHNWPQKGSGSTEAYRTKTNQIAVGSRDLNHEYDWDKMLMTYKDNGYTNEQAKAVSTLIADIGALFQVDYGLEATSGHVKTRLLYEHFGYSASMNSVDRSRYSDETWIALLKEELTASRPILYSGSNSNEGHQFILDGFTDDNYFHVNWGWGGACDGYYTLYNLVPDERGGYNQNQWACLNVKPDPSSEPNKWIKFLSPGISCSFATVEPNKRYTIDQLIFFNDTAVNFSGTICGALTNSKGDIKEWITSQIQLNLQGALAEFTGYSMTYKYVPFTIQNSIDIGDRIRFFYKSKGSEQWNLITSLEKDCQWEVLVADEVSISECTSFTFEKKSRIITLETKKGVQVSLFTPQKEETTAGLKQEGTIIEIDTKQLPAGEYTIKLQKGNDSKELKFSIQPL